MFQKSELVWIFNLVINDVLSKTIDLKQARQLLGQLLHTLQDFYSHSNWVELGNKNINENIGINEDIGPVASKTQSTCQNEGCTKITTKCVGKSRHLCFSSRSFLSLF